tara:strand:- start:1629 stop:2450 length:822 start_codon:yes stop_codon:yes gene_type:complete
MYIYKITNLVNGKVYIGLKTSSVEDSIDYYGSGKLIKYAIKKYGKDRFKKDILERDINDYEYLCEREIYWIGYYNSINGGYNLTEGGGGILGYRHTEETKEKLAKSQRGKIVSEETRQKRSEAMKGKNDWCSGEDNPFYGKKHTEESRRKMSEFKKNNPIPQWHRDKITNSLKGRKHSEESKKKMSEAQKGRVFSEESKRRMSESSKGIKHSEETKKKISKAMKGRLDSEETRLKKSLAVTGRVYDKVTCPHCGKVGGGGNMSRYHFDNCKFI